MLMCDDLESVDIDLDDADMMAYVEKMRNADPSVEVKQKINRHKIYMSYRDWETDRKSTRLNSSHSAKSRMPSSA